MATLTKQPIVETGLEPVFLAAAAGGDQFANDGRSFLEVDNADVSDKTVTITRPGKCSQGFTHNLAVVVTAGERRKIGPFPKNEFDDASGLVQITYSAVTSVTVGVFSLPS